MTPEQRIERKQKGKAMCEWFEGQKIPSTMQLRPGVFATDLKRYVSTHCDWLRNIDVEKMSWVLGYMRLYEVKINIEKSNAHNEKN